MIIHDKQGNVATFFRYKGREIEFNKEALKASLGRQSVDDALEVLRKAFVNAARTGDHILIDCG